MKLWPFNHKRQQTEALPEDIQEFYDSAQRQRTGMAWLLALATLAVTVILALCLFFGGRWIYQQFTGDDEADKKPTTTTTQQTQPDVTNDSTSTDQQGSSSTNTDQQSDNAPTSPTPITGPSATEVPDTGPGPGGLQ